MFSTGLENPNAEAQRTAEDRGERRAQPSIGQPPPRASFFLRASALGSSLPLPNRLRSACFTYPDFYLWLFHERFSIGKHYLEPTVQVAFYLAGLLVFV